MEAEVNQQMAEISKSNGFQNVLKFEEALKAQGIDPEGARASIRKRLLQQYVVQREVLQPIFQSLNEKDKREFYERHKDEFTDPGEVTLSEIFLPLEGRTAAEVEQRARRLVAELRAGADFSEAVKNNSPSNRATRAQNGKMGTFKAGEIKPDVAAAISALKAGEVTEPIRLQDGYQIVRMDDRKPSILRPYEEPKVQQILGQAVTMERADVARKKYIKQLREDAFIKVTKRLCYRPGERREGEELNATRQGERVIGEPHPFTHSPAANPAMRLDLFLKLSRLVTRRTLAQEMCDAGAVKLNGTPAKSAHVVRPGDLLVIRSRGRLTTDARAGSPSSKASVQDRRRVLFTKPLA